MPSVIEEQPGSIDAAPPWDRFSLGAKVVHFGGRFRTVMVQRRDSRRVDEPLYDGAGVLGLEEYFADSTRLTSSVLRYHFEPGASEGMHRHDAEADDSCTPEDSDELYLVLSGELVIDIDGERTTLTAGDAAYAPARTWHGIANESDAPAEMVLIFGPPRFA